MTLTNLQATVTKTAAFTGSPVDVSGITGDWTIKVLVTALSANSKARIGILDNPDGGTGFVAGPAFDFIGAIGPSYDNARSFKKQDFPDLSPGVGSGKIEIGLLYITPGASCTYRSWIEY